MTADEHLRVWEKAADRLDGISRNAEDERAKGAQHDLLCLALFARTIALAYRDFAIEQHRVNEAAKRLGR